MICIVHVLYIGSFYQEDRVTCQIYQPRLHVLSHGFNRNWASDET
jgi:hypothetical protein